METAFVLDTTSSLFLRWVWKQAQRYEGTRWHDGDKTFVIGHGSCGAWQGNPPAMWGPPTLMRWPVEGSHPGVSYAVQGGFVDCAFSFTCTPLAPERIQVTAQCVDYPEAVKILGELLADVARAYREAAPQLAAQGEGLAAARKRGPLGLHGGTLDRVREARSLVDAGEPKTTACRRAGVDPRTYDRYVDQFVDWEANLDE